MEWAPARLNLIEGKSGPKNKGEIGSLKLTAFFYTQMIEIGQPFF
jgi:hypothetical protein